MEEFEEILRRLNRKFLGEEGWIGDLRQTDELLTFVKLI